MKSAGMAEMNGMINLATMARNTINDYLPRTAKKARKANMAEMTKMTKSA